jgi:hypothetical protein
MADEPVVETGEVQDDVSTDKVELEPEQYAALLDRIEELEQKSNKVVPLDELVDEARDVRPAPVKPVQVSEEDLDSMSNKQLVDFIFKQADAALIPMFQQLDAKIETVRVLREIDTIEKDPECQVEVVDEKTGEVKKRPDFMDYKDEIYQIASKNPNLSLKEAYNLAKHGSKNKPKGDKARTLRALPPRPVLGERPGSPSSVVKEPNPKTVKSAAERAWEDTVGNKKEI